jgi:glycosyltransferase involved in cell wall biosynthesis
MRELAGALLRRGVNARVAVPAWDTTGPFASECRARGIEVDRTAWLQEREPRALSYLDSVRFALRFRAPVVHYHLSTNIMPGRYVPAVRWLGSGATFVTLHDPYADPPAGSMAARRWAHAAPRVFTKVIAVSRAGRERQISYGLAPDQVRLIYNGIDLDRFRGGDGERARARLGVGPSARLILVASRIAPQKRPLDALAAFAAVAADIPDAHLVFLGEGPLESLVRAEAARSPFRDRIHLPGYHVNVPDWLAAASAWLLPTESEGFSLAVVEALAAGCPIVTTFCAGNDEVLVNGENALLASVGDVSSMSDALRLLLSDDHRRVRLAAAGRETAARFSLERMVEAYLECYGAVLRTESRETESFRPRRFARGSRAERSSTR